MATTQALKLNFSNEQQGKKWVRNFTEIPNQTFADTGDARTEVNKYAKIVDGTFVKGELHRVEPFDAA